MTVPSEGPEHRAAPARPSRQLRALPRDNAQQHAQLLMARLLDSRRQQLCDETCGRDGGRTLCRKASRAALVANERLDPTLVPIRGAQASTGVSVVRARDPRRQLWRGWRWPSFGQAGAASEPDVRCGLHEAAAPTSTPRSTAPTSTPSKFHSPGSILKGRSQAAKKKILASLGSGSLPDRGSAVSEPAILIGR